MHSWEKGDGAEGSAADLLLYTCCKAEMGPTAPDKGKSKATTSWEKD